MSVSLYPHSCFKNGNMLGILNDIALQKMGVLYEK